MATPAPSWGLEWHFGSMSLLRTGGMEDWWTHYWPRDALLVSWNHGRLAYAPLLWGVPVVVCAGLGETMAMHFGWTSRASEPFSGLPLLRATSDLEYRALCSLPSIHPSNKQ